MSHSVDPDDALIATSRGAALLSDERTMSRRGFLGTVAKGAALVAAASAGLFSIGGIGTSIKEAVATCWHCYNCSSFCVCSAIASCYYQYKYCGQSDIHWGYCSQDCVTLYYACNECCRAYVPYGQYEVPSYWSCPCWGLECNC